MGVVTVFNQYFEFLQKYDRKNGSDKRFFNQYFGVRKKCDRISGSGMSVFKPIFRGSKKVRPYEWEW